MIALPMQTDMPTDAKPAGKAALRLVPKSGGIAPTEEIDGRDSYAVTAVADIIDRSLHATIARFTLGLSPAALAKAYFDWATHLAVSPGKRLQLVDKAARKSVRFANYAFRSAAEGGKTPCCIEPLPQDRRFDGADWQKPPYNFMYQAFLLQQQWWHNATTGIRGVTKHHEEMVEFVSRQILDMVSPSNFLATNPGSIAANRQQRRHEPGERLAQSDGRLGTRHQREEAGRHREFRGRARRGGDRPARSFIAID